VLEYMDSLQLLNQLWPLTFASFEIMLKKQDSRFTEDYGSNS
jgi:hypothetical protein